MPQDRTPQERVVGAVVNSYGLHDVLHALVEACYYRAEAELNRQQSRKHGNWTRMAQLLTAIEAEAGTLEF